MNFRHYFQSARTYVSTRSEVFIGIGIIVAVIALIAAVVIAIQQSGPKVVYQPIKACDILTPAKAENFLGDKVLRTDANDPKIAGNVATSKCGYTDENEDQNQMKLVAVAVQSGINDIGVSQNKAGYTNAKAASTNDPVGGIGDDAFFNKTKGQLNVLKGRQWYIFSNGVGASAEANTLDDALKLARAVVR